MSIKLVIYALLACTFYGATPACADWSELLKEEEATYFYDKEAIKAVHVTRFAWTLIDLPKAAKSPFGDNYQSAMSRFRVHCKLDTFSKVAESLFEKPLGKGKETVVFDEMDIHVRIRDFAIRPGTYIAALKKQICDSTG